MKFIIDTNNRSTSAREKEEDKKTSW